MRANEVFIKQAQLEAHLNKLQETMLSSDSNEIRQNLAQFVDGYKPWKESSAV